MPDESDDTTYTPAYYTVNRKGKNMKYYCVFCESNAMRTLKASNKH